MEREWRRQRRRRYLQRKCNALRAELNAFTAKNCSGETVRRCRRIRSQLVRLREQEQALAVQLDCLPTPADWLRQYNELKKRLGHLGYIDGDLILPRGELASQINFQEILITEFVFAGMLDELAEEEICALLVGVDYSGRFSDFTTRHRLPALRPYFRIADELKSDPVLGPDIIFSPQVATLGYEWARGAGLNDLLQLTTIEEGDVVSLLRRCVDVLRQLRKALDGQPFWDTKLAICLEIMDRDVVKVEL